MNLLLWTGMKKINLKIFKMPFKKISCSGLGNLFHILAIWVNSGWPARLVIDLFGKYQRFVC